MIDASVTVQQVGIMGNSSADPPEYYIGLLDSPGRLRILCEYLFQITMSPKKVSCRAYSAQVDGCGIKFYVYAIFDCQSAFDTDQTSQIKLFFVPVQVFKDYNLSDTEEDIMEPGEPTDAEGLMIEETGDARGQFRRVGCLSCGLQALQEASTDSAYHIDDSKCVQTIVDGVGQRRFIIDIV